MGYVEGDRHCSSQKSAQNRALISGLRMPRHLDWAASYSAASVLMVATVLAHNLWRKKQSCKLSALINLVGRLILRNIQHINHKINSGYPWEC